MSNYEMQQIGKWLGFDDLDLEDTSFDGLGNQEAPKKQEVIKETRITFQLKDNSKITLPQEQDLDALLALMI